jgi:hypothetical protein
MGDILDALIGKKIWVTFGGNQRTGIVLWMNDEILKLQQIPETLSKFNTYIRLDRIDSIEVENGEPT